MTATTAIFGSVSSGSIDILSWIHWRRAAGYHIHICRPNVLPPRTRVKAALNFIPFKNLKYVLH